MVFRNRRYRFAFLLGVVSGGLVVAIVIETLPKMMSQMMSGMMRQMMEQMGDDGCDPAEM